MRRSCFRNTFASHIFNIIGNKLSLYLRIFVNIRLEFFFRLVKHDLANNLIEINKILPCKGIGILHLAVGIDPIEKSKECTEILLKHGGDPNLW